MKKLLLIFSLLLSFSSLSQTRLDSLKVELTELSKKVDGLNDELEFSVSNIPLDEFLRAVGRNHKLNMDLDQSIKGTVTTSFSDVKVLDAIVFLCGEYNLDLCTSSKKLDFLIRSKVQIIL